MKKTIAVLFILAGLSAGAQDYYNRKGLTKTVTLSWWENSRTAEAYALKNKIAEMRTRQYKVKNGKRTRLPVREEINNYDTGSGHMTQTTQMWKGKIRYRTTQEVRYVGVICEVLHDYYGKNNKFRYTDSNITDTIANTYRRYIKRKQDKDYVLRTDYKSNEANRVTDYKYYTEKGKLRYHTVYEYYSPDKLKRISSYNGKGKLRRQYNYTCDTIPDSVKQAKQTSYCMRTDKDPMGNTIEIQEQRFKNKLRIVIHTYTPDKRLLQVKVLDGRGRVRSDLRYTYDDAKQLISLAYFHKNSRKPASEKKYIYQDNALQLTELYSDGKKIIEYEFLFKSKL